MNEKQFKSTLGKILYKKHSGDLVYDVDKLFDSGLFISIRRILFKPEIQKEELFEEESEVVMSEEQNEYLEIEEEVFSAARKGNFDALDTALKRLEIFCSKRFSWDNCELEFMLRKEILNRESYPRRKRVTPGEVVHLK